MADKILIVDDNLDLLSGLQDSLEHKGYHVIIAGDGKEALRLFYAERPDLLILDILMPKMDGWQVCQRVREMSDVPIIMLTARDEKEDIVKGLNLGADDYLVKPFDVVELLARVHAALRRARIGAIAPQKISYSDDYVSIDLDARRVTIDGELVRLTPTEYKLLALLVENQGQTLSFGQILECVWGAEYVTEVDYVRTYIWHLRRKLEPNPKRPRYLLSELDVGYRFETQR